MVAFDKLQSAARVSGAPSFLDLPSLFDTIPPERIFTSPAEARTEPYATRRFG